MMASKKIAAAAASMLCLMGAPAGAEPAAAPLLRGSGGVNGAAAKTVVTATAEVDTLSQEAVYAVQAEWRYAVLNISAAYLAQPQGDFIGTATKAIQELYGYDMGPVMFKPTLAAEVPFRPSSTGALSYFVGYEAIKPEGHSEDKGFAINGGEGWSKVVFVNDLVRTMGDVALTHGYYYFTNAKTGGEVAVEYSFVYKLNEDKKLKIILHHSSVPFSP